MIQLIDLLEGRIGAILAEMQTLQQENASLRTELEQHATTVAEENETLRAALAQEQTVREEAANRIDALLLQIKERITE